MNKTILITAMTVASALSLASAEDNRTLGEKTSEALGRAKEKTESVLEKAKDKTEDAGRAIANGTKEAVDKVTGALTPDADARRVDVKLREHTVDMPIALERGKTAFVVHNNSAEKRNFEIMGEGIDKKFMLDLSPDETKVLHVDLKSGSYKAWGLANDRENESPRMSLIVK